MNILWKVENVIINFYIRKWGRNIKQTALSIEHSPRVKRIVSGITGELTRKKGRNENQLLWRDGKDSSFYRTAFNKSQQNAPCTTSQGERGVNGDTIAQTAVYTQPQEETKGHLILHFRRRHTDYEYFYCLVYALWNWQHVLYTFCTCGFEKACSFLKKLVQLPPRAFQIPLSSRHLVLIVFNAYLRDSEWTSVYPPVYPCHVRWGL